MPKKILLYECWLRAVVEFVITSLFIVYEKYILVGETAFLFDSIMQLFSFFFSAFYISALCMIVVYWRSKFILYNGLLSFGHAIFWSDTCNDFCGSPEAEAFQSQIKFCVILWFTHVWLGIYNLLDQSILGETVGIIWCSWNVFFNASQPFFLYVWM